MNWLKQTCHLPQCQVECCEAPRDMDQDEDNGEYWLEQLDGSSGRLQQIDKTDEQTMGDKVRDVLRKNKLELY